MAFLMKSCLLMSFSCHDPTVSSELHGWCIDVEMTVSFCQDWENLCLSVCRCRYFVRLSIWIANSLWVVVFLAVSANWVYFMVACFSHWTNSANFLTLTFFTCSCVLVASLNTVFFWDWWRWVDYQYRILLPSSLCNHRKINKGPLLWHLPLIQSPRRRSVVLALTPRSWGMSALWSTANPLVRNGSKLTGNFFVQKASMFEISLLLF